MTKRILSVLLAVIIAIPFITNSFATDDGKLHFRSDGTFRILQIADPQDGTEPSEDMLNLIRLSIAQTDPDLIVMTGDNVNDDYFKKLDYDEALAGVTTAVDLMLQPIVESGIPFAVVMGNNDYLSTVTADDFMKIYSKYDTCIIDDEVEDDDRFCYNIEIAASDSDKTAFNIWMMDTGSRDYRGNNINKEQLKWYKSECKALAKANGGEVVPSIAFQHMAVSEISYLFERCSADDEGAVEKKGTYWRLNTDVAQGCAGVISNVPGYTSKEFKAWQKNGDVVAAFFGHTHYNSLVGEYEGITLSQTAGAMFAKHDPHGVRLIVLNEENPTDVETQAYFYTGSVEENNAILSLQVDTTFENDVKWIYSFAEFFRQPWVLFYCVFKNAYEWLFN